MGGGASKARKEAIPDAQRRDLPVEVNRREEGKQDERLRDEDRQASRLAAQREKVRRECDRERNFHEEENVDPDLLLDEGLGLLESDDDEGEGTGTSEERRMMEQNHENWSMLKHSLEMSGEDLLLNMLYFSDDNAAATVMEDSASMGKVLDGAMTETFALHSENNTPYKLKPVPKENMDKLKAETMDAEISGSLKVNLGRADSFTSDGGPESKGCGLECVVCKEELELGDKIMRLPHCGHTFHEECLSKWFKHQDWCPICRSSISGKQKEDDIVTTSDSTKKSAAGDGVLTTSSTSSIAV